MIRRSMVMAMVALVFPLAAQASEDYPEAYAARPLVLNRGMVETGLDYGLGLNKGRMAKDHTLDLSVSWGVVQNLQLGLVLNAMNYASGLHGAKFGGVEIGARYRIIDLLGVELQIYTPGDRTYFDSFSNQLLGTRLGIPFQWVGVGDRLKVHAGLGFDLGFVKDTYPTSGGKMPQMSLGLDYGVSYNPIRQLFLDLSFGTQFGLRPAVGSFGDRVVIPVALTIGGTLVRGKLDLFGSFALANLKPPVGNAFDGKSLGIGARMRF